MRLEVKGLSKAFGGVHAVDELDFTVEPGQIYAVIGPNGAGKTTLFNLISGIYRPDCGEIRLNDERVTNLPPEQLAARGMLRTFQHMQVCMNMSALENVMLGRHLHTVRGFWSALLRLPQLRRSEQACREQAAELLEFVGCHDYLESAASALPYGALKRLEIARALAAKPGILLLDEPAAGLNTTETAALERLIASIAADGITVVLVEHDMKLVMSISEQVLVLDYGRRLAVGTPTEVRQNPDVIAAYLGG
ncbi:high-affinity branched-chain amino acid ABC transporter ATP-binding protein LivG [Halorhodospira abdelmalekii]|uniref:ABC transporter ATP-binding protein n=1 Tax=Halorhodospira abdelmalekii TaxID=421629 RepID=UPI0019043CDA|nr:ABC transporter ATP-binding protein [Halorhodospira abdelmalekii]MBK1736008.1 high-affinity branched-chain amino acid ABC transporter ATP-binding protein LivG [Halorhodospira abdelmalekii]